MNFVKFESALEKEKIRDELRNAREELLKKAKKQAEIRAEREISKKFKGESDWIHPLINDKIEKIIKEQTHKKKKSKDKKNKKSKKNKRRQSSERSSDSSSTEEEISRKKKKKKKKKYSSSESSTSSNDSGSEEWVEKTIESKYNNEPKNLARDSWMTEGQLLLKTFSKEDNSSKTTEKNKIDSYDPSKCSRELNPHWKDGGKGLPAFQKPKEDDCEYNYKQNEFYHNKKSTGNWRKSVDGRKSWPKKLEHDESTSKIEYKKDDYFKRQHSYYDRKSSSSEHLRSSRQDETKSQNDNEEFLNDQQMNQLGAKLIKAEIMGNDELAKKLKEKLEKAREVRKSIKDQKFKFEEPKKSEPEDEHILLTTTNSLGMTKPLSKHPLKQNDPWGGRKSNKRQKAETHVSGERVRFFPDDDRYDIKQMFEREKYTTGHDTDAQFMEIAGKHKNPKDDLEDIFADKIRQSISDYDQGKKEEKRAVIEHERFTKILESCDKCFDSPKMEKGLMIAMGSLAYLSIPSHKGLQPGHCLIIPMQHISCSTQLDDDAWNEVTEFRKGITRMFASKSQDVIFFEIANYLHKKPHMVIHCIPGDNFEVAPMYFKKAIQESEYEWSTNKQLIVLKEKDLRKSIPKGLPYFWVHFGMDLGFAHVIEDQHKFKPNFAQEIIGGMLNLNHKTWRNPRKEHDFIDKVKEIAELWKPFDFTT